jgi:hypothetical protein
MFIYGPLGDVEARVDPVARRTWHLYEYPAIANMLAAMLEGIQAGYGKVLVNTVLGELHVRWARFLTSIKSFYQRHFDA